LSGAVKFYSRERERDNGKEEGDDEVMKLKEN
jgi:hypothetical protein